MSRVPPHSRAGKRGEHKHRGAKRKSLPSRSSGFRPRVVATTDGDGVPHNKTPPTAHTSRLYCPPSNPSERRQARTRGTARWCITTRETLVESTCMSSFDHLCTYCTWIMVRSPNTLRQFTLREEPRALSSSIYLVHAMRNRAPGEQKTATPHRLEECRKMGQVL